MVFVSTAGNIAQKATIVEQRKNRFALHALAI